MSDTVAFAQQNPLAEEQRAMQEFVDQAPVQQIMGPLAPLALSPFFGLTCLSAVALLQGNGWVPENAFLDQHPLLSDTRFFIFLALLTLLTSLPKLFTVSKIFAQAVDQLEAYAGFVLYALAVLLATASPAPPLPEVLQAGVIALGQSALLLAAGAFQYIVIYTVKYFLELLALITPLPLLDAAFELANKSLCLALALIYLYNPYLALIPGFLLFLMALALYWWARRGMVYWRSLLIDPVWKALLSRLLGMRLPEVRSAHAARISHALGEPVVFVAKAFPAEPFRQFPSRSLCYFAIGQSGHWLVQVPWWKPPIIEPLRDYQMRLVCGVLACKITLEAPQGQAGRLVLSRWADYNVLRQHVQAAQETPYLPASMNLLRIFETGKRSLRNELF